VVGIFLRPNDAALVRLASGLLVEINDEWLIAHRYISLGSIAQLESEQDGPGGPVGAGQPALEGALAGAGKSTT
jgi:hypothetical protein